MALELILSIYVLIIFIFWFISKSFSLGLYLIGIFILPSLRLTVGNIAIGFNLINLILLFLCYLGKRGKLIFKPIIPFLLLYILQLFIIPFQTGVPFLEALKTWMSNMMFYLVLPIVLYNELYDNPKNLKTIHVFLAIIIFLIAGYGLYLTTMPGENPYVSFMTIITGQEFNETYALADGGGRLFGRISSVFFHPMAYAFWIGLSLIYVCTQKDNWNIYLWIVIMLMLLINIVTCGIRSVLGAIVIVILYYLYSIRQFKVLLFFALFSFLGYSILQYFPDLFMYLNSMIDQKSSSVQGSSIDMRLNQLNGCFDVIQYDFLFGKGYEWHQYYMHNIRPTHPVLLAFESLVFVVLCNSGVAGCFIWIWFVYRVIKENSHFIQNKRFFLNATLLFYLSFSSITGEYGYMRFFIIYYIIIYANFHKTRNLLES